MSCQVCDKHVSLGELPGGVIYQNEHIFIAHFPYNQHKPMKPHYGHVILELKRHITSPAEMTEAEASATGIWLQRISEFLEKELEAEHTYLFRIGDVTPHLHFHAVPRFKGTSRDRWGIYLYENPLERKADVTEIQNISKNMRAFLLRKDVK